MPKRIQFSRNGGPEVLEFVDHDPGQPGPGEVLVRHAAIGVNFIDIYYRTGLYAAPSLPSGLGLEAAGTVEAVGEGVTGFAPGDRVGAAFGPLGTYAQLQRIPATKLVKLPDGVSFDAAAASMLKGLTVQYLFRQIRELKAGDTVLFHAAAGGVGLIACQWARVLGVRLIGTAGGPEKCELARKAGAAEVIDYRGEDVVKRVLELTDGKKVATVYDGVGKDTWAISLDCAAPRGLVVSFGNASGPVDGVNLGILAAKGSLFVTRPTLGTYAATPEQVEPSSAELFGLIASGAIVPDVSRRYPLADAGEAQTALASRVTTGSLLLVP
ncbi:quinone oxidoreductase family protein [Derxia gummosa]|uniref:Quinone oxidoreductase family protein n=1 Tax=Derxia gummosa DSM 723 TaxID=1121388 RepID=A0A8B6X126_9BURK|nr:quinone oxidoreductase [Derxia gummosa]